VKITVHKKNERPEATLVSVVLLDWSCRERFHTLKWLANQTVPRQQYELIWVELFNRVVPAVMEGADVVISCGQEGVYHKHKGYNAALLRARGKIITVCDSDAVFPPNFIESVIKTFRFSNGEPTELVLMHHERRTDAEYPDSLKSIEGVSAFTWKELLPNVGACVSVRRTDAIRFGGFDEHRSYRGFVCGPYDLAWRLVNAGIPEIWHDPAVGLWHFSHPAPYFHPLQFSFTNLRRWFEVAHPHFEYHAFAAVEAFSTGRLLPLEENADVHNLRMSLRKIGTPLEEQYASKTKQAGFSKAEKLERRIALWREGLMRCSGIFVWVAEKSLGTERALRLYKFLLRRAKFVLKVLEKIFGPSKFQFLRKYSSP
jgi:hypothetical protein